jgi:hypothetical protein
LYTNEKFEYEFQRPVTAVALDPLFAKTKKPKFVTGGKSGQLVLHTKGKSQNSLVLSFCVISLSEMTFVQQYKNEKCVSYNKFYFFSLFLSLSLSLVVGFFGQKTEVLHQNEGPIYAIKWRGSLIAWANDLGVKIWDLEQNQRITFIDRPK